MKRKVNINRPKISSEEIATRKNFNSVLQNHAPISAKPLLKKPWFLSSVIVATVAIVSTAVLLNKQASNNKSTPPSVALLEKTKINETPEQQPEETKACINPPLKGVNVSYTTYKINAEKGALLDFKTGSKLVIPKNAFVDDKGNIIKGDVELRYREFHDPVDFFVSGIPMTYDSAGVKYQFESAGMMEMLAYQNSKPVKMAPQKSIQVELASNYPGTAYNLYKLDTSKNNWACLGKDKVDYPKRGGTKIVKPEELPEYKNLEIKKAEVTVEKETKIAALPKPGPEPKKPESAAKAKYIFTFEFALNEFPELAVYKNVLWKVGEENKNFNINTFNDIDKTEWESSTIKEGTKKGENYLISLQKGKKKYTDLIVYPAFEGENLKTALNDFKEIFTKYTAVLEKRKADEKRIEDEYQTKLLALKQQQLAIEAEWKKTMEERMKSMDTEEKVMRMFTINSFGVYNCDNPSVYPKGIKCNAVLSNDKNVKLMCYSIFLVDNTKNGLFTYYKNPISSFSFDPKAKNILWTVENGVLYWMKPEQFNEIKGNDGMSNLKLTRVDEKFTSVDAIKKYFDL